MSMHYFSFSGGPGAVSIKSMSGHITSKLCFCIWWEQRVTYCILEPPGYKTPTRYFSCSAGPDAVSIKSAPGTITLNLCFCIRSDLQVV
jgi:hypothetical protein